MRDVTLLYLLKGNYVYLARKAKKKFGGDLLNGYGGKKLPNESIEDCVVREAKEECNIIVNPSDLEKVAIIDFYFPDVDISEDWNQRAHVFVLRKWQGTPKQTKEMLKPALYPTNNLPYEQMWAADSTWLKEIFSGRKLTASIYFTGRGEGFRPYIPEFVDSFN